MNWQEVLKNEKLMEKWVEFTKEFYRLDATSAQPFPDSFWDMWREIDTLIKNLDG